MIVGHHGCFGFSAHFHMSDLPSIFSAANPLGQMRPSKEPLPLMQVEGVASKELRKTAVEMNRLRNCIENVKRKINLKVASPDAVVESNEDLMAEGEAHYQQWKALYLQVERHIKKS